MNPEIVTKILNLNYQFYQSFADDFSETRQRLQPGVIELLERFRPGSNILDLGCGNGEVAKELAQNKFSGSYLGTDFSSNLLQWTSKSISGRFSAKFIEHDLSQPSWKKTLPENHYDIILCFAALHHIPGYYKRLMVCKNIRQFISDQGQFFHSNWQFLNSDRFNNRIIPWREVNISDNEVEEGDYLLDWRRGGMGTRYVHHFTEEELNQLAKEGGFRIKETFFSDGKEGNLSIYQVWEPV